MGSYGRARSHSPFDNLFLIIIRTKRLVERGSKRVVLFVNHLLRRRPASWGHPSNGIEPHTNLSHEIKENTKRQPHHLNHPLLMPPLPKKETFAYKFSTFLIRTFYFYYLSFLPLRSSGSSCAPRLNLESSSLVHFSSTPARDDFSLGSIFPREPTEARNIKAAKNTRSDCILSIKQFSPISYGCLRAWQRSRPRARVLIRSHGE